MRRMNRLDTERAQQPCKQQKPPVLHPVYAYGTWSPNSSPEWMNEWPVNDCQSPKNLIYHIQNSTGEEAAPPLLKVSPTSHLSNRSQAQSSSRSSWLPGLVSSLSVHREDYRDKKPKLPSEVHIGKTRGIGHKTKQEISQLSIRKKSDHQKLEQSNTDCPETLVNRSQRFFLDLTFDRALQNLTWI